MAARVVNIRSGSHYDVYIGRAGQGENGYFGNPLKVGDLCGACGQYHHSPASTLPCYSKYFHTRLMRDAAFLIAIVDLRNLILGCFCKPRRCHGDIIVDWVNTYHGD